ncbi:MAG: hypothetical protein ACK559_02820, partial [bacterium]
MRPSRSSPRSRWPSMRLVTRRKRAARYGAGSAERAGLGAASAPAVRGGTRKPKRPSWGAARSSPRRATTTACSCQR